MIDATMRPIDMDANSDALAADLVDSVSVSAAQATADHVMVARHTSRAVDAISGGVLTHLAHRTLVPASDASRAGAGGQSCDRD